MSSPRKRMRMITPDVVPAKADAVDHPRCRPRESGDPYSVTARFEAAVVAASFAIIPACGYGSLLSQGRRYWKHLWMGAPFRGTTITGSPGRRLFFWDADAFAGTTMTGCLDASLPIGSARINPPVPLRQNSAC